MDWGVDWGANQEEGPDRHVHPLDDRRPHQLDLGCWCKPWRHPEDPRVVVHVAVDRREDAEPGAMRRPS